MADYIGVIEFERPLYCKKEVSGKTTILDVRNAAAHEGIRPLLSATKICLENCKKLIEVYQPEVLER